METESIIRNDLSIRYVRLHFTLEFTEDAVLPPTKASAIRGGIGQMLLNSCCIRDQKCGTCDFRKECLVQRMFYSEMEIRPEFMNAGDSAGYIVDCTDYRDYAYAGSRMNFSLTLFGKNIVYFSQYLNAVYMLGKAGLGKSRAKFGIVSVSNSKKGVILNGNTVEMAKYEISTVYDYVEYRLGVIGTTRDFLIKFQAPLSVKYQGIMLDAFSPESFLAALKRRIYIMDCFEGIPSDIMERNLPGLPEFEVLNCRKVTVRRYSERKSEKVRFSGIEGEVFVKGMDPALLPYVLAGEILNIGKNTSFGFGRYILL